MGCGFFLLKKEQEEWGQNSRKEQSATYPLLSLELCGFTVPTHATELLQFQLSTHFFPGSGGVKHQGVPIPTLHKPRNFKRKDFWKSSAEKGWQNTM